MRQGIHWTGRILLVCGLTLTTLGVSNVSSFSREQMPPPKYSVTDDRCAGLLEIGRVAGTISEPAISSSATARQTALGLMLGVRSVVGPREAYRARTLKVSGVDSERAKAVARYRQCRSQQTLESFASN